MPGTGSSASRRRCRISTSTARERSPSSRAAPRSASRWRARWSPSPTCCSSTSRPTTSTSTRSPGSRSCCVGFKGSVMVITHDRAFLDAVATRIVELDRGVLRSYPGAYDTYEAQEGRAARFRGAGERSRRQAAGAGGGLGQEGRRGAAHPQRRPGPAAAGLARATRGAARIARPGSSRGRCRPAERQDRRRAEGRVAALRRPAGRPASESRLIVSDFSATILRGDKVGLIGPNGAGKTTLLKLILGELQPTSGTVRQGTRLEVAYFDQMRSALDLDATLADAVSPGSEWVETAGGRKHVMSYLADFLFSPARANSPLRTLSGGERNRVLLARLLALPANVLVLDEPTNDLDIDTLELLEELLQSYAGTVFLVSHDRRFLDNVVTSTIAWEGDVAPALWREYEGGYEDWKLQRGRASALRDEAERKDAAAAKGRRGATPPPAPRRRPRSPRPSPRSRASSATRSSASSMACRRGSRRSSASRRISARCSPAPISTPRIRRAPRRRRCATPRSTTSCWPRSSAGKRSAHRSRRPRGRSAAPSSRSVRSGCSCIYSPPVVRLCRGESMRYWLSSALPSLRDDCRRRGRGRCDRRPVRRRALGDRRQRRRARDPPRPGCAQAAHRRGDAARRRLRHRLDRVRRVVPGRAGLPRRLFPRRRRQQRRELLPACAQERRLGLEPVHAGHPGSPDLADLFG